MVRAVITFALFLYLGQAVTSGTYTVGVALGNVSAQADDPAGTAPSAAELANVIVRDTFDDNTAGPMWEARTTDPNNCNMREVNRRLELQATSLATEASAGFVSKRWRLDPKEDFSMKVDWRFDVQDRAGSALSFGVVADANKPWERNVVIGVGYRDLFPYFWYRNQTGSSVDTSMSQRMQSSGQLSVSYNAADDELYLGVGAYGKENAWMTFPGLLNEQWGGQPIFMWLGGDANGSTVASGQAYLDNLLVESGIVIEALLKDVHRFWAPLMQEHFYTISELEKEIILTQLKDAWTYEGVVYRAFADDYDSNTKPVHRFWAARVPGHFYTLDTDEYNWVVNEYSHVWTYEGVAFHAYPEGKQPVSARPVYRFWSPTKGCHFYTANNTEREGLLAQPYDWIDEGIAWYALP